MKPLSIVIAGIGIDSGNGKAGGDDGKLASISLFKRQGKVQALADDIKGRRR